MKSLKVRIHGATLRATSVTRCGYTVATFRATSRAILDQRLPSSHAMMFTNPKCRHLTKKSSEVLALMLLDGEEKARIKRRNRRVWVRGWIARRQEMGAFHRIVRELATEDPSSFMEYLRMDEDHFNHLVSLVSPLIKKDDTCMREAISPAERVALTLPFLATGESFHSLAFQFRISRHAISYIVDETCAAITEVIGKEFMQVPQSEEQWLRVREKFYERWNFPNCLGAIDGKHIVMLQPAKSGSHYRNYKGSDSVVLLAIVGPNYKFLYVDVGANG